MKGIILAGGSATRLHPASLVVSKQLMPVYDKPLIYYPLTTLILSGIQEILLISTSQDLPQYRRLFANSKKWGVEISFAEQKNPGGIAEALLIGEEFIKDESVCLILGDNLFHGIGLGRQLSEAFNGAGALITAYQVSNPHSFGVVEFDNKYDAKSIEEKPQNPKSNWAVPGIYFYDYTACERTKSLVHSTRGELEITDLNISYLNEKKLKVSKLPRGTMWLDMGTTNTLLEASQLVKTLQDRQGLLIGSPEEAAWRNGWVNNRELLKLANSYPKSQYTVKLMSIINEA